MTPLPSLPTENLIIREVFFDWDGTFANTEKISLALTRKVLADYATETYGDAMHDKLDKLEMRGKDFGQIAKAFQDAVNAGLPENRKVAIDIEGLRTEKLRPQAKIALLDAQLAPGIGDTVAELQDDMKLGVAIVSNSPRLRIQPLLEKHAFTTRLPAPRLFSAFEDVAGKMKEDPAIYLHAAKTVDVAPAAAAAVEDSVTGMRAAFSAGIGLRVGFTGLVAEHEKDELKKTLLAAGAHVVIDDMRKLPDAIRAHNKRLLPQP